MDSVAGESCQWGKLRLKATHAAGSQSCPGTGGTGTTEGGHPGGHGGTHMGRLVASPYEKHFRAWKPCSTLEAGSLLLLYPSRSLGVYLLESGSRGTALWAAMWTAREALEVCTLNDNNFIQLTAHASEESGGPIYVVQAGYWDFLLGKLTNQRRNTRKS